MHTETSGENEINQSRRCRAPIASVDAARELAGQNTNNQNENFSKMEKIERNLQNEQQTNTKCQKQELPTDPAQRKESQKNKNPAQNRASNRNSRTKPNENTCEEARVIWGDEECG